MARKDHPFICLLTVFLLEALEKSVPKSLRSPFPLPGAGHLRKISSDHGKSGK
jgi:hypothetical protein